MDSGDTSLPPGMLLASIPSVPASLPLLVFLTLSKSSLKAFLPQRFWKVAFKVSGFLLCFGFELLLMIPRLLLC